MQSHGIRALQCPDAKLHCRSLSNSSTLRSPVHIEDEPYCRQRQLICLGNRVPELLPDAWVAPNAVVVGDVDLFDKVRLVEAVAVSLPCLSVLRVLKDACCQATCLSWLWQSWISLCWVDWVEEQQAVDIAIHLHLALYRPMDAVHIAVGGPYSQLCSHLPLDCCAGINLVWVCSQGRPEPHQCGSLLQCPGPYSHPRRQVGLSVALQALQQRQHAHNLHLNL